MTKNQSRLTRATKRSILGAIMVGARQELGARLGDFVTGKLQGAEGCRQGVLVEVRGDGSSVIQGESVQGEPDRYVCQGWLARVPDVNFRLFPSTVELVARVRAELAAAAQSLNTTQP